MDLVIVSAFDSSRLSYVLDWIFKQQLQLDYRLSLQVPESNATPILYYGIPGPLSIPEAGLLQETGVRTTEVNPGTWQGNLALFPSGADNYTLPFDLFAAVFYLLSRYEEYLPFNPDHHGRYPAEDSILYRHGQLERPLIDIWLNGLRSVMRQQGISVAAISYSYLPTYDIDIAWSYRHKGWKRNLGGYIRSAAAGDLAAVRERTAVLLGKLPDPYDAFDRMEEWHLQDMEKPVYFILAALDTGVFDKNISPQHPAMQQLVRRLAARHRLGIHPSYDTDKVPGKAAAEKQVLEQIAGKPITLSRQHYIKLRLPDSYRQLTGMGIEEDYSMGYGTHAGFRAGTSRPFYWYDLQTEQATALLVHPFCFMDATARYESGLDAAAAFDQLDRIKSVLQQCGGRLVTIFHNFSLGTDKGWAGWAQRYQAFLKQC